MFKNLKKKKANKIVDLIQSCDSPYIQDYHNGREILTSDKRLVGVEVEFEGNSTSKIPAYFLGDICRPEYDGSVSVEWVQNSPMLFPSQKFSQFLRKIQETLKVSDKYFNNEIFIGNNCGTHINISVCSPQVRAILDSSLGGGEEFYWKASLTNRLMFRVLGLIVEKMRGLDYQLLFGRNFTGYAKKYSLEDRNNFIHYFFQAYKNRSYSYFLPRNDRYYFISFEKIKAIEFRLPKFNNLMQFRECVRLCYKWGQFIEQDLLFFFNKIDSIGNQPFNKVECYVDDLLESRVDKYINVLKKQIEKLEA